VKLANRYLSVLPVLVLCISATNVRSAVITSGSITITGGLPTGSFNLSGAGFNISGAFSMGNWGPAACRDCGPGTILSVNGFECCNDFSGGGSADISGSHFNVNWGGLNAAGNSTFLITGAPVVLNRGAGTYTSNFNFSGELCGVTGGAIPQPCVVNLPSLTGSGVVSVNVSQTSNTILPLRYTDATYVFSTIPEPSTVALTLPAALLLYCARRRNRRSDSA
jgi:hypothetical protein